MHGVTGTNWSHRNMHMAGQIQGAGNLARKVEAFAPGTVERLQKITRGLFGAERKQMAIHDDPKIRHFIQDYHGIPQEWMDALQDHLDKRFVTPPQGSVNGKTWANFRDDALDLGEEATNLLNAGRKKHGEETVDHMGPLHPSSYSSMGTGNLVTRQLSELGTGLANTANILTGAKSKGFGPLQTETLKADLHDAFDHHAKFDKDGYYVPKQDFRYLSGVDKDGKPNARVKVEGNKIYMLDENGNPIDSPAKLNQWIEAEKDRFVAVSHLFGNVAEDPAITASGYHRQFPYLRNAHKATFQDLVGEIVSRRNEAAALDAHPVDMEKLVNDLKNHIQYSGSPDASKLIQYIGEPGSTGANTLMGRIYQQKGRLPSGGEAGAITKILQAWMPFAYKMQLGITPTPAAAQQAQVLAQTAAFQLGDKGWTTRFLKSHGKAFAKETAARLTPGARSELNLKAGKHTDMGGMTAPMEIGSALVDRAIKGDAERIMGNALEHGNQDFLESAYTPEELDHLRRLKRPDGTVDLSDPADREFANSVIGRYLEGHNGLDLATSKPALLQGQLSKALGMYMATPSVVTKAVTDLYRPGGMFHTGNRLHDLRGQAHVTAALTGQIIGSNLVRSSAILKALSLLSAGAILPAASSGYAALNQWESSGEKTNQQNLELLQAAANRLATGQGDMERHAKDFADLAAIIFAGSIPMKGTDVGSLTANLAGTIDQKALGYNAGRTMQDNSLMGTFKSLGTITPAIAAPVGMADAVMRAMDDSKISSEGRWLPLLMRGLSPDPFLRSHSPLLPREGTKSITIQREKPSYGGITTFKP